MTKSIKPTVSLEQFASGTPDKTIIFTGAFLGTLTEPSEKCPVVGQYGAHGPIVWVLLDDDMSTLNHVLVDRKEAASDIEVMNAAIEKITWARDELMRLNALLA